MQAISRPNVVSDCNETDHTSADICPEISSDENGCAGEFATAVVDNKIDIEAVKSRRGRSAAEVG